MRLAVHLRLGPCLLVLPALLGSKNEKWKLDTHTHAHIHLTSQCQILMGIVKVKVAQSCPTLCDPKDYTVHGILQARILKWVAIPFSRVSSQSRNQTRVSCIAGGFFTNWAIREALTSYTFGGLQTMLFFFYIKYIILRVELQKQYPFILSTSIRWSGIVSNISPTQLGGGTLASKWRYASSSRSPEPIYKTSRRPSVEES